MQVETTKAFSMDWESREEILSNFQGIRGVLSNRTSRGKGFKSIGAGKDLQAEEISE